MIALAVLASSISYHVKEKVIRSCIERPSERKRQRIKHLNRQARTWEGTQRELQRQRREAKTNTRKQVSNSRCMNYHTPPRLHSFVDATLFAAVLAFASATGHTLSTGETFNSSSSANVASPPEIIHGTIGLYDG